MNQAEEYIAETSEKGLARGYLRLSMVALGLVALVAVTGCVWMALASGKRHAYVVTVEHGGPDSGRTEVVAEGFKFKPQPPEVGFFLRGFCRDYFSRNRVTIDALPRTLLYFAPSLRGEIDSAWKSARTVENAVNSPTQVSATATEIHLTREGTEAYITIRLDRTINGQKAEPQSYSTYIQFDCLACDGKPLTKDDDPAINPLGFRIGNIPGLEEAK